MKKSLLFCALCSTLSLFSLVTFDEMKKKAGAVIELPPIDNKDFSNPDYSSYLRSITPSYLRSLFTNTIADQFKTSLIEILNQRTKMNIHGKIIAKLQLPEKSKLIIFSNIKAGLHSFMRSLQWLIDQKIISKDFAIIKPDHYIFLNGNSINYGPYNIETLLIIFTLLQKNPDSFFYIRGKQEINETWIDGGLKYELNIRFNAKDRIKKPLEDELNKFFETLPIAVYIGIMGDPHKYMYITSLEEGTIDLEESLVGQFISMPTDKKITYYNLDTPIAISSEKTNPEFIAVIQNEDWRRDFRGGTGIGLLGQVEKARAWSTMSTPIIMNQKLLKYYWDAFLIVTLLKPLENSIITLYRRDSRTHDSFKKFNSYNIVSAIPVKDEKSTNTQNYYRIGSSMSLKQGVPVMGQQVSRGLSVRLNNENNKGGIHDTLLQAIIYNDNYNPALARQNIETLKNKDHIDVILLPIGSPTLASYLDYVRNTEIAVLFPVTGAVKFRDPTLKGIVNFRGSYTDEVNALIDYMIITKAVRRFAFFYQDDDYGLGPLKAAHIALSQRNITDFINIPYQRGSINLTQQAQKIKEFQPDAIGLFSTSEATQELIHQIGVEFLTNTQLFGISFLGEESFRRYIKETGLKVLLGAVVPNPKTSNLEIVKEYRESMDKNKYYYDVFSLEAYIGTSILMNAMQKIEGQITKDKILTQLESLKNESFKGLELTFNPARRDLSNYIWIETGENEDWIQKKISNTVVNTNGTDAHSTGSPQSIEKPTNPAPQPMAPNIPAVEKEKI